MSALDEAGIAKRVLDIESLVAKIHCAIATVDNNNHRVRNEINDAFEALQAVLMRRKTSLLEKVDEICRTKKCIMEDQLGFLEEVLDDVKNCSGLRLSNRLDMSDQSLCDIYKGFYPAELATMTTGQVLFDGNVDALSDAIAGFGDVKTLEKCKSVSTLPRPLEEYDDFVQVGQPVSRQRTLVKPDPVVNVDQRTFGNVFRWLSGLRNSCETEPHDAEQFVSVSLPPKFKFLDNVSLPSADFSNSDLATEEPCEWLDTFSVDEDEHPDGPRCSSCIGSPEGPADRARAIAEHCRKIWNSDASMWRVRRFR